jgi:hypothetical protein
VGPKGRARGRRLVSVDPDHRIGDGRLRWGAARVYGLVTGATPSAAAKSPEMGQMTSEGGSGSPARAGTGEEGLTNSLAGLRLRVTRGGRTTEGGASGGSGNSREESLPWGGGIRRDKAWTSSSEVRGTLQTNARA